MKLPRKSSCCFCFWMDCIHSLPRGLDGWKRRSAITDPDTSPHTDRQLRIRNQYWIIGGAMFRYHLLRRIKGATNRPHWSFTVSDSSRKEPRQPDRAVEHNGTFYLARWAHTSQASLIFHNGRNISRIGTQIKLSRFGFFSTQKLYTSHQNFVIYMRTILALDNLCWYILRVIYYSASSF
jgi:hypothetical protein